VTLLLIVAILSMLHFGSRPPRMACLPLSQLEAQTHKNHTFSYSLRSQHVVSSRSDQKNILGMLFQCPKVRLPKSHLPPPQISPLHNALHLLPHSILLIDSHVVIASIAVVRPPPPKLLLSLTPSAKTWKLNLSLQGSAIGEFWPNLLLHFATSRCVGAVLEDSGLRHRLIGGSNCWVSSMFQYAVMQLTRACGVLNPGAEC
jgi:hypothetical protein